MEASDTEFCAYRQLMIFYDSLSSDLFPTFPWTADALVNDSFLKNFGLSYNTKIESGLSVRNNKLNEKNVHISWAVIHKGS